MDSIKHSSGDNNNHTTMKQMDNNEANTTDNTCMRNSIGDNTTDTSALNEITPQMVEDNENNLKHRIAQCRDIIDSLKAELNAEKSKPNSQTEQPAVDTYKFMHDYTISHNDGYDGDLNFTSSVVSASVDSKLHCDESLMAYEKQLEKYQNTLKMAQMEKKNTIRKKMLAKAYKMKLLEVENQCNIELLRVQQSLQCIEPLQMIIDKWKTSDNSDVMYDSSNLELLPRYPELSSFSGCDVNHNMRDEVEAEADDTTGCGDTENDSSPGTTSI